MARKVFCLPWRVLRERRNWEFELYGKREQENGREKLILTCLEPKVEMYKKMGFQDNGIANSA